jgi:hypothetical protein
MSGAGIFDEEAPTFADEAGMAAGSRAVMGQANIAVVAAANRHSLLGEADGLTILWAT